MGTSIETRLAPHGVAFSLVHKAFSGDQTGSIDEAGANERFPTEPVLCGLGACTAMTLHLFADLAGLELGTISVVVTCSHRDGNPRIRRSVAFQEHILDRDRQRLAAVCEKTPWTLLLKQRIPVRTEVL